MNGSFSPSLFVRAFLRGVEYTVSFVLFYTGLLYLYSRIMIKRRITMLYYHEIGDVPALGGAAISAKEFERQMKLVARWYRGISIDDLHGFFAGTHRLPDHPALITFDGGYRGVWEHAVPVLRRHGIPVTIYLVTGYIDGQMLPHAFRVDCLLEKTGAETFDAPFPDGRRSFSLRSEREKKSCRVALMRLLNDTPPGERDALIEEIARRLGVDPRVTQRNPFLSWEEIAAAGADDTVRFASHSVNHPNLSRLPAEEARREITASKETIERMTGRAVTSFCYPMGYYSAEIKEMVRDASYRSAATVRYGLNGRRDDPMELKRIAVHEAPLCVFATELCGIYRSGTMMEIFDRVKSRLKRKYS